MQDGISTGLIYTGAVVKDSPATNPIDLIFRTNATPVVSDLPSIYTPINVRDFTTPIVTPAPEVLPNIANVASFPTVAPTLTTVSPSIQDVPNAPAAKSNTGVILVAAGLGALLLFSKDEKKALQGITGIGKKNKKTSLLPLLLVGGAAAYWYFTKDNPAAAAADVTLVNNTPSGAPAANPNDIIPGTVSTVPRAYTGGRTAQAVADFIFLTGYMSEAKRLQLTALDNTEIHQVVLYLFPEAFYPAVTTYSSTDIAALEKKYGFTISRY